MIALLAEMKEMRDMIYSRKSRLQAYGIRVLICHIEYNRSHINSLTFDSLLSKRKGRWRLRSNLRCGKHFYKIYYSICNGFLTLHFYFIVQKSPKCCRAWFRLKKRCYH